MQSEVSLKKFHEMINVNSKTISLLFFSPRIVLTSTRLELLTLLMKKII